MLRTAALGLALLAVGALGLTALVGADDQGPPPTTRSDQTAPAPPAATRRTVGAFLDTYVGADGRVQRPDQGGDTVSEGQAYALLLATAVGDEAVVERVWSWTRAELQRPDGLLATRWRDGAVVDHDVAPDADLDAARALLLAGARFGRPDLTRAGRQLGRALAARVVVDSQGGPELVAGDWAAAPPLVVNPSYASPRAFQALAEADTGPWTEVAATARRDRHELAVAEGRLPPDWAVVGDQGLLEPTGPPGEPAAPARFGFDAVRVPIRLAESCDDGDRALAAAMRPLLGDQPASVLELDGQVHDPAPHAVAAVARAASATADGDAEGTQRWLQAAEAIDEAHPTYYGAAWLALGHVMLTTDLLGGCPPG